MWRKKSVGQSPEEECGLGASRESWVGSGSSDLPLEHLEGRREGAQDLQVVPVVSDALFTVETLQS